MHVRALLSAGPLLSAWTTTVAAMLRSIASRVAVLAMAATAISACSATSGPQAAAVVFPTPTMVASQGTAFRVSEGPMAADVTLSSIRSAPIWDQPNEYVILTITIVGRSSTPFRYDAADFAARADDGPAPYYPPGEAALVGPDDRLAFSPALGSGSVGLGRKTTGVVTFRGSSGSKILVTMTDPIYGTVVEWLITAP